MNDIPFKPLVLIPSYNPGPRGLQTVIEARTEFAPIWLIADGSTDGSDHVIEAHFARDTGVRVLRSPRNCGKGAAVLLGLDAAKALGFTHVLTMDSDGQHPANRIVDFIETSRSNPHAMILGRPVFGPEAPQIRVKGRRISNVWAKIETLNPALGDSLFGFRIYPLEPLHRTLSNARSMRGFDFDPETLVRLTWQGLPSINLDCEVIYPRQDQGGISHFRYGRDNLLLTLMHLKLLAELPRHLPGCLLRLAKTLRSRQSSTHIAPD